jgi:hypothetical protein
MRWAKIEPNEAWAARYDNEFQTVKRFLEDNAKRLAAKARREFVRRAVIIGAIASAVLAVIGGALAWSIANYRTLEREHAYFEERARNARQIKELQDRYEAQLKAQIKELEDIRLATARKIEEVQRSLPVQASENVRSNLEKALQAATAPLDSAEQRVTTDPQRPDPKPALDPLSTVGRTGFMWLGSLQKSNLRAPDGKIVLPNAVDKGKEYIVTTGIYLRSGLPDPGTYRQQSVAGEINEGSRIRLIDLPKTYPRSTGDQYWAEVKVLSVAMPTVYFQFAGGSREQAQQMSNALQAKGYKIPGEERTGAAAGKQLVRYFDEADKPAAAKLAQDAGQVMRDLGYSLRQPFKPEKVAPGQNTPDGTLELWVEIPPR